MSVRMSVPGTGVHPGLSIPGSSLSSACSCRLLLDLLVLDREGFAHRFRSSPVLRAKWEGFLRNVCIAARQLGDPKALEPLADHLHRSPPLVAAHAAWALGRLHGGAGRERAGDGRERPA